MGTPYWMTPKPIVIIAINVLDRGRMHDAPTMSMSCIDAVADIVVPFGISDFRLNGLLNDRHNSPR